MTGRVAKLRWIGRDPRGAAATEFALILIPMCLCILGMLDVGFQFYVRAVLQGTLNDVARTATVEKPVLGATGDTIEQKIDAIIKERVGVLAKGASYAIVKNNYHDFADVGKPEKIITDKNKNGAYDLGDCWEDANANLSYDTNPARSGIGGADDVVFYDVTLTMPRIVPMAGLVGASPHYVINAKTAVRNQPYANQAPPAVQC